MLCLSFDWLMGKAPRDLSQCVIGCLSCDVIALFKFKVTFRFSRSTQILGKFPVSMNGFYPLRSTSNFASFPSFLTASYSCVILPFFLCSNQLFFHSRYSQATTSTCGRWCVTTNLNCSNSYTNLFGLTTSPCVLWAARETFWSALFSRDLWAAIQPKRVARKHGKWRVHVHESVCGLLASWN